MGTFIQRSAFRRHSGRSPETVPSEFVPAKRWLEVHKKHSTDIIPYVGSLTLTEKAQISNWFETNISKDPGMRHMWMELLPLAHAYTVFLTMLFKLNRKRVMLNDAEVLEKAWTLQLTGTLFVLMGIDVD